jgi:DNA repair exonuclease SbcCD ATPase subunit
MAASKNETTQLVERIEALEAATVEKYQELDSLEAAVSAAYASGGNSDAALKKLRDARSDFENMRKALDSLDEKLVEVSARENDTARAELKKRTEGAYKRIVADLEKALGKAVAADKELPKAAVSQLKTRISEAVRAVTWESANGAYASQYTTEVPPVYRSAPEREASGARKVKRELPKMNSDYNPRKVGGPDAYSMSDGKPPRRHTIEKDFSRNEEDGSGLTESQKARYPEFMGGSAPPGKPTPKVSSK